ncbi:MAG: galactokinase [Chthoniobacterales bacterium]|nr:galactokinase [Chthoniobacterales bacterium]
MLTDPDHEKEITGSAPGRAEWLGNHTDYNDGLVLGIGLDVGATVRARVCRDHLLRLHAADLGESHGCSLDNLQPAGEGSWANYAIGVAAAFLSRGAKPCGLELEIRSTVPMGAGLSSSAALECATARVFQQAWGTAFDDLELARIGQEAEHKFAGVRCGLLDQVTSLFATRDHAVFLDCRSLDVRRVPVPADARFVIVQSGVKHALSDGAYNARRSECEQAARALGVSKLRDASDAMIAEAVNQGRLSGAPQRRASHVVGENARVAAAVAALEQGDLVSVGKLMNQSHESSRTLFENSCGELDFLSGLAREIPGCLGARLTGGGFGGAILALVGRSQVDAFVEELKTRVLAVWGREPAVSVSSAGGPDQAI